MNEGRWNTFSLHWLQRPHGPPIHLIYLIYWTFSRVKASHKNRLKHITNTADEIGSQPSFPLPQTFNSSGKIWRPLQSYWGREEFISLITFNLLNPWNCCWSNSNSFSSLQDYFLSAVVFSVCPKCQITITHLQVQKRMDCVSLAAF